MTTCRFLGNACIELIGSKDHIIIDPAYIKPPTKGIEKIFFTHQHSDHIDLEKLTQIRDKFSSDKEIEMYGPKIVQDEFDIDLKLVKTKSKIKLNNGMVKVYQNDCWKAESCVAYLITIDNKYILHTADSAKFSNELRHMRERCDYCFVACFEDHYSDYLKFIKRIGAGIVIPYHFNEEKTDIAKGLVDYLTKNNIIARYIKIGESFEI